MDKMLGEIQVLSFPTFEECILKQGSELVSEWDRQDPENRRTMTFVNDE